MFKPALFDDLRSYSASRFRADLFAGLTVGIVALPLAMAFAIAGGLPPERGLYTAIAAGFLISVFSGSRFQIGGPTGAFVVIIFSIHSKFGYGGLAVCTLMAGIMLILFGVFKAGALLRYIPFPVITGFTSGIAVTIFSTQLKDIFGLNLHDVPAAFLPKLKFIALNIDQTSFPALGLCAGTVAAIMLCRRFLPKWPAMLIGMLLATAAAIVFGLDVETIGERFGELPRRLPLPSIPSIPWGNLDELVMPALTIALLAAIESLLCATVADGMTGSRHRPNTELIAEGIGNIGSIVFGGIPATGAIARTATNIRAGATSQISGLIHAVTLGAVLLLLAPQAKMIPLAALAGIMVVVCYNMSEYRTFVRMFKGPRSDWLVMLCTFFVTVLVDLVAAVQVGVLLSALLFMRRMSNMSNVRSITSELQYGDAARRSDDPDATSAKAVPAGVEVFEIQGPLFFGAVERFKECAFDIRNAKARLAILRMRYVPAIDATGLNVLEDFVEYCGKQDIPLVLSGVRPQPRAALERYGLIAKLGAANVCEHIDAALARAAIILGEDKQPDLFEK